MKLNSPQAQGPQRFLRPTPGDAAGVQSGAPAGPAAPPGEAMAAPPGPPSMRDSLAAAMRGAAAETVSPTLTALQAKSQIQMQAELARGRLQQDAGVHVHVGFGE